MLLTAKKPVIYSGGGVINSGPAATKLLRELVEISNFPITSTLMGLGAYPASGKNWLGMLGMHGTYEANMITRTGLRRYAVCWCTFLMTVSRVASMLLRRIRAKSISTLIHHRSTRMSALMFRSWRCCPCSGRYRSPVPCSLEAGSKRDGRMVGADQPLAWTQFARLCAEQRRDHAAICTAASEQVDQRP